ncbi:Hypothetical protein POVR1_LOCUS504 [uncultured virus]|nr:Hypothetical protein POVR1_LOCUS504 [uncultured virus]
MDESLGYYVDLLIQQGDLVQLVGFYKADLESRKYIDRNLDTIRQSLGFPTATSFRQIVEAFDKANIDVISAAPPLNFKGGSSITLEYISSILDQTREALKYAFVTKNLDIIKYAIKTSRHYLDYVVFLVKIMGPMLKEFEDEFSAYPSLRDLISDAINATITAYPYLTLDDVTHQVRPRGGENQRVVSAVTALDDYLSEPSYQEEIQPTISRRRRGENQRVVAAVDDYISEPSYQEEIQPIMSRRRRDI